MELSLLQAKDPPPALIASVSAVVSFLQAGPIPSPPSHGSPPGKSHPKAGACAPVTPPGEPEQAAEVLALEEQRRSGDARGSGTGDGKVGVRGRDPCTGRRETATISTGDAGNPGSPVCLVGVRQGVWLPRVGLSTASSWAAGRARRGWKWTGDGECL